MKKESEIDNEKDNKVKTIDHQHAPFQFAVWLGAFLRYFMSFGQKSFETFYTSKYRKLNFWVGLGVQVLLGIIFIIILALWY